MDQRWIAALRGQLRRDALLFDDPGAYLAGVEDALAAVCARLEEETDAAGRATSTRRDRTLLVDLTVEEGERADSAG